MAEIESGYAAINNARIYYEMAGTGVPFVMIHAGVADSRQWNNEFAYFADNFHVLRYDLRGYGKSEPVDGEYSHLQDLKELLDKLKIDQPAILMGCSMGGGLAMNFTLTNPTRAKALIMVDSGPNGLELVAPGPAEFEAKFEETEKAYNVGDLERVAELETQIWFDGLGRSADQVNQGMRRLTYEMDRNDLALDARHLGKRLPDTQVPAFERLGELHLPVLLIVGVHDTPYILAASDYMKKRIPIVQKVLIKDAAHLSNMDQPEEFRQAVRKFLTAATIDK